jgi:hypothetical protein
MTWDNAWFNAPCIYWQAPRSRPVNIDGRGIQSMLLVDETLDAATPFEGSLEVRNLFPHSVLIAEPGGTTYAETPPATPASTTRSMPTWRTARCRRGLRMLRGT